MKNRNRTKALLPCAVIAFFLLSVVWIYVPSGGTVTFLDPETGETIEEALTREEVIAVKKILWGRIGWPEWLYGYPACGFGEIFSITIEGVCYMPAWDSCGMVARMGLLDNCTYMNISQQQKQMLAEIITARGGQ